MKADFRRKRGLLRWGFVALIGCSLTACRTPFRIAVEPPSGSSGDVVAVQLKNAKPDSNAVVAIGGQKAPIIKSSEAELAVIVPPVEPQATRLKVTIGNLQASAPFEVLPSGTIRFWFSLNNNNLRFLSRQASNEEFRQDKTYSPNKMQYELFNRKNELVVIGYISDPTELEVPSADRKGLSRTIPTDEVQFSINVPAFSDLARARFSLINASTKYEPRVVGEVPLSGAQR